MGPQSYLVVLSFAAQLGSGYAWSLWGRAHGLAGGSAIGWLGASVLAWLMAALVHEGGHAFVAWGCRLQVMNVHVGPLVASRADEGWQIRIDPNALAAPGFSPRILTTAPNQPRQYLFWTATAGPLASMACAIVLRWAVVHLDWPFYAVTWRFCGLTAAFAMIGAVVNLVPFAGQEGELSDGARVLQHFRARPEDIPENEAANIGEAAQRPVMSFGLAPSFAARSSGLLSIASSSELNLAGENATTPTPLNAHDAGEVPNTPILIGRSRRRSRRTPESFAISPVDAFSGNAVLATQAETAPVVVPLMERSALAPPQEAALNEDREGRQDHQDRREHVPQTSPEAAPEITEAQQALLARLIKQPAVVPAAVSLPHVDAGFALPFRAEFLASGAAEPLASSPVSLRTGPFAAALKPPSPAATASSASTSSAARDVASAPVLRPVATSFFDHGSEGSDESRTPRRRVIRIPSDQPVMAVPRAPFDPLALLRAGESS